MKCSDADCSREAHAKDLCSVHYKRQWRRSQPNWQGRFEKSLEQRFWEKVEQTDTCWLWKGANDGHGYGDFVVDWRSNRHQKAYRFAYELANGTIPDGLVIDHLCRNRKCVRPTHLEAVTVAENNRRSALVKASRPLCSKEHPYTPENTRVRPGRRQCLTCERERASAYREKNREAVREYQRLYMRKRRSSGSR